MIIILSNRLVSFLRFLQPKLVILLFFIICYSCQSENENRPYIVATGAVSACCWVEGSEDERQMYLAAGQDHNDHNINYRLLSDILTEEPYVSMFAKAWASQSNPVCIRKCGHMRRSRRRVL